MENTPIDIKWSQPQRIFDQQQKKFRHLIEWGKKPTDAAVPLKNNAGFPKKRKLTRSNSILMSMRFRNHRYVTAPFLEEC